MTRSGRAVSCLAAFAALLASGSAAVAADRATTAVSGQVKDSTGAVVAGALVTIKGSGTSFTKDASTDARGGYTIDGVPPGAYLATAFQGGFVPVTQELQVGSAPATLDFTLSIAGFSEEVTVSFTSEHAYTALKADAPARDIPLTVKSYTGAFIKAIDTKQVAELYTYMNGVNRSGNGAYDSTIRGFSAGEPNAIQMDGLPGLPARQNSPNVANVDRIEVLKGPASVLYGRAQPGGLINIITKRPQATPLRELELRGGTFFGTGPGFGDENSFRFDADLTGPVGGNQKVLYRLVASYDKVSSFRTDVDNEDVFVVPALTFSLSPGTVLTVDGEYRRIDNTLDQGLVAPQNDIDFIAPINTHYQEPGDFEEESGWSVNARFAKQFTSGSTWNATLRSVFHDDQRRGFENFRPENDNRRLRRRDRDQRNKREYHYIDTYFGKTVRTGAVAHNVLVGLNGGYELRDFDRLRFNDTGFFIDLYDPVYGQQPPATPNAGFHQRFELYDYAGYLQDRLDIGSHWKALASVRYSGLDSNFEELRLANPDRERTLGAFTPTVGLVYQPDTRWSLYGSFSKSYDPQNVTAVDAEGNNDFDPEEGRQIEAGVKAELVGGRVDATAAVYHIEKKNVLVTVGTGISDQIGAQRAKGFELDLRLRPLDNWQMILGYAYTDAVVTDDVNTLVIGAPLVNQAKNGFNVWSRYDVTRGAAKGLGFGVGLIYRGERPGSLPAAVIRTGTPTPGTPVAQAALLLPSYFRADAGVYFARSRYELTLRVNNVFDRTYYESAFNLVLITPGNPREATLSMRVRF
jgi:iron complex outermembrane receptor protein